MSEYPLRATRHFLTHALGWWVAAGLVVALFPDDGQAKKRRSKVSLLLESETLTLAPGADAVELVVKIPDSLGRVRSVKAFPAAGKILHVGDVVDGAVTIRYRPPSLTEPAVVSIKVVVLGKRKTRQVFSVTVEPAAEGAPPQESEASDAEESETEMVEEVPMPRSEGDPERATAVYILWGIDSLGVEDKTIGLLSDMLKLELEKLLADRLKPTQEIQITARTAAYACGGTPKCIAKVAEPLGVRRVISGVAAQVGESYDLNLSVIDATDGKIVSKARASLSGERSIMLGAMQLLVYELIDPSLLSGSLMVNVPLDGVNVFIDGELKGTTPLTEPIGGLAVGEHALKLSSPMMRDYFTFFSVHHGKIATVEVEAEKVAALQAEVAAAQNLVDVPIFKRWWFWTAVAGVVLGTAGATAFAVSQDGGNGPAPASLGLIDHR